jgi:hypothetical protein
MRRPEESLDRRRSRRVGERDDPPSGEIIETVHARRAPMIPASATLRL